MQEISLRAEYYESLKKDSACTMELPEQTDRPRTVLLQENDRQVQYMRKCRCLEPARSVVINATVNIIGTDSCRLVQQGHMGRSTYRLFCVFFWNYFGNVLLA
jgi:hypothetical protein